MTNATSPMTKLVGFYVSWTEYERGWGCRPDGYHFYATAEIATADTKKRLAEMRKREEGTFRGMAPDEYSSPDNADNPRMAQITPEMAKEIEEKGVSIRRMPPYNEKGQLSEYYPRNYPKETF